MDGQAWTVGELAHHAGIARNTASEHVRRLVQAGLVNEARQGRHCYLTLRGPQVVMRGRHPRSAQLTPVGERILHANQTATDTRTVDHRLGIPDWERWGSSVRSVHEVWRLLAW